MKRKSLKIRQMTAKQELIRTEGKVGKEWGMSTSRELPKSRKGESLWSLSLANVKNNIITYIQK